MVGIINIIDHLLEKERITIAKADHVLYMAAVQNSTPLKILLEEGLIASDILIETISETMELPILEAQFQKITILNFNKVSEYSDKGYFICKDPENNKILVISNPLLLEDEDLLKERAQYQIMLMKKQEFYDALDKAFSKFNTQKALLELGFVDSRATAKNINYVSSLITGASIISILVYISTSLFVAINYLIYLSQTLFKIWIFTDIYLSPPSMVSKLTSRKHFPLYTVLVPMYKENYGVKAILHALDQLIYPKHRLDIKLVVEEDDEISLKILSMMTLPEYVHVIKVPYSEPRTKPKALNYAMQYARGEYMVIYDVEDRPDKDQLLKALEAFENSQENVICVQAKLNFYNRYFNLLSRLFSIEYSIWFNFFLPGLEAWKMPIPLGGNSNHFKVQVIKKLGLWDAYNVTEDADLGIRIFMHGYSTKVIESYTMEEAPTDLSNWVNQRARWIKGFIQTFLVYYGQKSSLKANISFSSQIGIYMFVGFATYSFFIIPWHFLAMIYGLSLENQFLSELSIYITILYMYFSASIIIVNDTHYFKKVHFWDVIALLIWPLYFLLHSVASYKALWELLTRPFSWNKTEHAVSHEDYEPY